MTDKTISTPNLFAGFAGDSNTSSRGVSEVVGTASLIVLALGLVGGVAAGLGGVTDGINNNGLDGDFQFNQDGDKLTIVANSLSDAAIDGGATFAIQVESQNSYDPAAATSQKTTVDSQAGSSSGALEDASNVAGISTGYVEQNPQVGATYVISDPEPNASPASPAEGETVTITAFDGEGNGQIIAQFTFGSV